MNINDSKLSINNSFFTKTANTIERFSINDNPYNFDTYKRDNDYLINDYYQTNSHTYLLITKIGIKINNSKFKYFEIVKYTNYNFSNNLDYLYKLSYPTETEDDDLNMVLGSKNKCIFK